MCLTIIDKRHEPPLKEEREAWGVFDRDGRTADRHYDIEVGKWMLAQRGNLAGTIDTGSYEAGFHKFRSREAAEMYSVPSADEQVRRVKLRGIIVEGQQQVKGWVESVDVAREMYVCLDGEQG